MPHRSLSMDALRRNGLTVWPGMTIFWIGDPAHQSGVSGHNPDDTPGVQAELSDADSDPEVRALDFMVGPRFSSEDGWRLVNALVTSADKWRLYYVIWQRSIWHRGTSFQARPYTGSNPHTDHVHVSGYSTDDANGADWQSVLALSQEGDMADVFYKIQSNDSTWNGQAFVSNRIHRRKLRNPGEIQGPAKAGATEVTLTDALRLGVSTSETWEKYLDSVAGPEFPAIPEPVCTCNCDCGGNGVDHTHEVTASTGPATPSG